MLPVFWNHEEALINSLIASTYNNGSYLLTYFNDWPELSTKSGCNYTLEISAGGERALSEYFSVVNTDDGGLPTNIICPSGKADINGTNKVTDQDPKVTDQDPQPTETAIKCSSRKSYSAGVLGGAIAGVSAFFILLLTIVFYLGRWSVSRKSPSPQYRNPQNGPQTADYQYEIAGDQHVDEMIKNAPPLTEERRAQLPVNRDGS